MLLINNPILHFLSLQLRTSPMARSHRKLFPSETATNQTFDCFGFCEPSCPSNCDTNPNYYYFSPPPPPPPQVNHVSSYLIILISLFTLIFLIVGFYVIKVKCYAEMCGRRGNRSGSALPQTQEFLDEDQVDHPVWFIATVGLQQSIINSITVCKYRKDEGLIEGSQCSVCLNEFCEGETLRLLPKCSHAFHISCIDTWLRSHTNCPLCRAGIVSNNGSPEEPVSNLEQENNNLGRNQENQETLIENHGHEGGSSNNIALENRAGTGESSVESNSKEQVLNDPTQNHGVLNNEMKTCKTMRRSSIEECLHIRPVPMKRSFYWNGRFLSIRGYMNLNSTLPY